MKLSPLFISATGLAAVAFVALGAKPDGKGTDLIVRFYLGTECPASQAYVTRINEVATAFADQGVQFECVFPQGSDDQAKLAAFTSGWKLSPVSKLDPGAIFATSDDVRTVPTVVVILDGQTVYRGAIDDNKNKDLVKRHYLRDALEAIVAGKPISVSSTEPVGCALAPGAVPAPMEPATYASGVATILNDHCVTCHRPDSVAPFSLVGYENAKGWSEMAAVVAESRKMPPWKAEPGYGEFKHENRLSEAEIATLRAWHEAGAPRGDASKEPEPPTFSSGWQLGEPDLVIAMQKEFSLEADGQDEYWNFVIKPDIKEPMWIAGIDCKPGNKRVVHHVIAFLDESGQAEKKSAKNPEVGGYKTFGGPGFIPSGSLGGWAPGLMPTKLPDGAGFMLKPGATVVLQVHYHKSGKPEKDLTKIGLYKAKGPMKERVEIAWLANPMIRIPAGDSAKSFSQSIPIPVDVKLYSLMPHMHLLGKSMKATWVKPDGTEQPLIYVKDWDFNWQLSYALKSPITLPKGSKIRIEATYDNSDKNPFNPNDPPKDVRWGEETTDEMMLLVAAISVPSLGLRELGIIGS